VHEDNEVQQMPTYKFSPEQSELEKRSFATKMVVLMTFGCAAAVITAYLRDPEPSLLAMMFPVAFLILIGSVIGYIKIKPGADAAASLQITVEQDRITMEKTGTPGEIILRSEISRIVEIADKGIRVDSVHKFQSIFVPKELSGYEQIRSELMTWALVETKPDHTYAMYSVFLVVGCLVYYLLTATSGVRVYGFEVASILGVLVAIIFFVFNHRKNSRK
jgi:hypothetical protein